MKIEPLWQAAALHPSGEHRIFLKRQKVPFCRPRSYFARDDKPLPAYLQSDNIYQQEINSLIKLKLDLLFNFDDEESTIKKFKQLNDSLKSNNKILKHYRDMKNDIINNSEKQERLAEIDSSLEVLVTDFKQNISQYQREGKLTVLKDAMETYVDKVLPLLQEKNKLQYVYQKMEFNGSDDTYHLIQHKFLPNKMEDVVQPSKIITNKR